MDRLTVRKTDIHTEKQASYNTIQKFCITAKIR